MEKDYENVLIDKGVLPKRKNGNVNWKDSVGINVPFVMKLSGKKGYIKILKYFPKGEIGNSVYITIQYNNLEKRISASTFLSGKFVDFINGGRNIYKKPIVKNRYNIGDVVTTQSGSNFKILGVKLSTQMKQEKHKRNVWYYVECVDCGYRYWKKSNRFMIKRCPNCTHQITWPGVNDIVSTDPWMIPYFQNGEKEASKYRRNSNQTISPICPICKKILKPTTINNIYQNHGVNCPTCSDSFFYPEKYMISFLDSLNIEFIHQASYKNLGFDTNGRIYDFYIPMFSCIVETHGAQHYEESNLTNRSLEEEMENDRYKQECAIKNGIQNYIVINCLESSSSWIKNSILSTDLLNVLKVDKKTVQWDKISECASKNLKKEIWKKYNETYMSNKELADIYHISPETVKRYLIDGNEINVCTYNSKLEQYARPVEVLYNGECILTGVNRRDLLRKYNNIFGTNICLGTIDAYVNGQIKNPLNLEFRNIDNRERRREILYGDSFKLAS